eukprot:TRINITY_DN716_c0_g1_i6.p1 TRINITY_DN716_c0_g1~~TRINITY_DN716_c0_g1_i6.p1  ORF type:complete len:276 (+),score=97.41 TRINITY_DN716_c0_g1_i6:160-987(+)
MCIRDRYQRRVRGTNRSAMAPSVDPRASMAKRRASKEQAKKLKMYGIIGVVVLGIVGWLLYAEMEASGARAWADSYPRKCEACQTMIVSGIWTRSLIGQQEIKRIEAERAEAGIDTPLTDEERNPPIRASIVLRYMCQDGQIDQLMANVPLTFGDGFTSGEDPDFATSVKKLCWYAMNNETVTKTFKKMLETPITQMQNPTLISVAKVHGHAVCAQRLGVCTEAQLEPGLVDVPMPQQGGGRPRGSGVLEEAAPIEDLDQRPDMGNPIEEEETEL